MAKMSIEMFRNTKKRANTLLEKHQCFMHGIDTNGVQLPMTFFEDIQELKSEINQCMGEVGVKIKALPEKSSEPYRNILQKLEQADMQLKETEQSFLDSKSDYMKRR